MKIKLLLLFFIIFCFFAAIFVFERIRSTNRLNDFKNNGITTTATISEVVTQSSRDRRVSGKTRRKWEYYITVTYFTKEEKTEKNNEEDNLNPPSADTLVLSMVYISKPSNPIRRTFCPAR